MSRVLVTGAKGFLGKSVVKTLNKNKDFEVISLGGRSEWDLTRISAKFNYSFGRCLWRHRYQQRTARKIYV